MTTVTNSSDFLWDLDFRGSNKTILKFEFAKSIKVILR